MQQEGLELSQGSSRVLAAEKQLTIAEQPLELRVAKALAVGFMSLHLPELEGLLCYGKLLHNL